MSPQALVLTHTTAAQRPPKEYDLPYELDGTSWAVRENLVGILERELMGPANGPDEVLVGESPVTKYLVGRIAPAKIGGNVDEIIAAQSDGAVEAEKVESVAVSPAVGGEVDPEFSAGDGADQLDTAQQRGLMIPASMGMRFQIPKALGSFVAHCRWGSYDSTAETGVIGSNGEEVRGYARTPHDVAVTVDVGELRARRTKTYRVEDRVMLRLDLFVDHDTDRYLIELALCNDRECAERIPVVHWMFQTQVEVDAGGTDVFLPIHDWMTDASFERENDGEQRRINLQYRNRLEFAVGRTCSVDWDVAPGARRATAVRTTWLPMTEVPQVQATTVDDAVLDMEALAVVDAAGAEAGLRPIACAYGAWLGAQEASIASLPDHLRSTAQEAVDEARQVAEQLSAGIDYLVSHEAALACFHFMNRVMADQRVHSQIAALRTNEPDISLDEAERRVRAKPYAHHWRVFQLAFVLMQVISLMEPAVSVRSGGIAFAQLIFFPTGGGKTEAYLGLAAFAFAARRLQGRQATPDGVLEPQGVTVLMRYTLRLLTSQQFQRAAALVCAAELERRRDPKTWGEEPFRLGLWVGSNVTPKRVEDVSRQINENNNRSSAGKIDALQLAQCPWCGRELGPDDVRVDSVASRVYVHCHDKTGECPFCEGGEVEDGLPVLTVDEEIYRLVPSFVIATVDKFVRLAREGEASSLFGYVGRTCDRHGYVPQLDAKGDSPYKGCSIKDGSCHPVKDGHPKAYVHPTNRLRPPDLIIQDELHLITGALGTTVGLFESVIDTLCTWHDEQGRTVKPLVVASSATMRNSANQIRSLYGRDTRVFPPQVLDVSDTFFSRELEPCKEHPGRRYVGVSAAGVRLTATEIQVASLLMKSGQLLFDRAGKLADPYMTLVGYFSATRELAGMARYMQDDVTSIIGRSRFDSGFPRRYGTVGGLNIGELTSRIASSEIVRTLGRMALMFNDGYDTTAARGERKKLRDSGLPVPLREGDSPFDAVLATSMLQVGVDVPRLGLMMVVGQPKNTAEYIQASSRVGRDASRPGLVVSLGNWARPRDLAHFEQFRAYHESFYARVEPLSVTPYSVTSLERGASGLLVSIARVLQANEEAGGMAPETAAGRICDKGEFAFFARLIEDVLYPRFLAASDEGGAQEARRQLGNRLDAWAELADDAVEHGYELVYERGDVSKTRPLMQAAETLGSGQSGRTFKVANSMREVQPEINILVSPDKDRLMFTMKNAPAWNERASDGNKEVELGNADE